MYISNFSIVGQGPNYGKYKMINKYDQNVSASNLLVRNNPVNLLDMYQPNTISDISSLVDSDTTKLLFYNLHKYINIPYEQYKYPSEERDIKLYEKRLRIIKDWIPIRVYPYNKLKGQDCWVYLSNYRIDELKTSIDIYKKLIQEKQFSSNIEAYEKEILKAQEELENIPEKQYYNMGYGKFYLFVKRSDFEREVTNMV